MKKIYLKCWFNKNLGDDLFVKIISDRYKNKIYSRTIVPYKKNFNDNVKLTYINEFMYKVFNKIAFLMKKLNVIESKFIKKSDIILVVGGSIFMESKDKNRLLESNWYDKLYKDYYIIGSNIGPVYTKEYINDLKYKVFEKAKLVSLRDKKSYDLVSECKNVQYTCDMVFSLNVDEYKKVESEKKVIISVIDCYKKASQLKNVNPQNYDELIIDAIYTFNKKGYKVQLMSFCEYEGDKECISRLVKKCPDIDIECYYYNGNIEDALYNLAKAEIIVGTRFHANILGFLLEKKVIPIAYNDKTINMLDDIKFKGLYIDLNNMPKDKFENLYELNDECSYEINNFKNDALKHFEKLDDILVKR